jgi:hypothetical protein
MEMDRYVMSMSIFEFTESDLNSNRLGLISARQQEQLNQFAAGIRKSQWSSLWVVGIFLPFALCLILGMYLSNESSRAALFSSPWNLIVILAVVPIVLAFIGFGIFLAYRRANKLSEPTLKIAEGVIAFEEESSKYGPVYYVIVDETEFTFAEPVSKVFPEGSRMRIYYCETSFLKYILSYETLS